MIKFINNYKKRYDKKPFIVIVHIQPDFGCSSMPMDPAFWFKPLRQGGMVIVLDIFDQYKQMNYCTTS